MANDPVLFLGGPWHGQRHVVADRTSGFVVPVALGLTAWLESEPPFDSVPFPELREVRYTSRKAPGSGIRVMVAPDYRYDTEEWFATCLPDVTDWERLSHDRFWRGLLSLRRWLYVLGDEQGRGFMAFPVSEAYVADYGDEANSYILDHLTREMAYHLLPLCVVPDCTEKGEAVFTAAAYGRLAGREWRPDDEIRLCPAHAHDVYRAQGAEIEDLPAWLAADAQVSAFSFFSARHDLSKGREPQGRMTASHLPLVDDRHLRLDGG